MTEIHKIKITKKMLNKMLENRCSVYVPSSCHDEKFKITTDLAFEHDFEPFELWFVKTAELLPNDVYSKGLYKYNDLIEIPQNSKKIAIHRNKTTANYFIKYEPVPVICTDGMTPDFIFDIKNSKAVLCA